MNHGIPAPEGDPSCPSTTQPTESTSHSPAEREARLQDLRARQHEQIASETPEETAARLQHLRARQHERIASETPGERAARLQDLTTRQHERIASETPRERTARLQDLTARQQERIASETPEDTAARRQRDREAHSHRAPPAQPLLHQPAVQARMTNQLVSTCTTCLEGFPGMTTRHTAAGTVCIRCHRDTHSPKAYSGENNMHPGPVPTEFEVGVACSRAARSSIHTTPPFTYQRLSSSCRLKERQKEDQRMLSLFLP